MDNGKEVSLSDSNSNGGREKPIALQKPDSFAASLQMESELNAIRFYKDEKPLAPPPPPAATTRDYLRILFRHKGMILAAFVAVMASLFVGLELMTPVYEARVKMLISGEKQVQAPYYRDIGGYRNVPIVLTQSELVNTYPIIQYAAKALNFYGRPLNYEKNFSSKLKGFLIDWKARRLQARLDRFPPERRQAMLQRISEEQLKSSIKVQPIRDTNIFTITFKDFSPSLAAAGANVISRSYTIFDLEQQLAELQLKYGDKHSAIVELKDSIERMSRNLNGAPLSNIEAIGPASVKILEQAVPPLEPVRLPRSLILFAGAFASLFLGMLLAFLFDYLDPTFKGPQDVESYLDVPLLGSVSKAGSNGNGSRRPGSPLLTRSYQNLADHIYLLSKHKNLRTILVTSAGPQDETGRILFNICTYLAQEGSRRFLLVDANLRHPQVHKAFNISNRTGLIDVLNGNTPFQEASVNLGSNLTILPGGVAQSNPVALMDSPGMSKLIKDAPMIYDVTFINCPNIQDYRDAYVLSPYVDGVVLVINEKEARRHSIRSIVNSLESMGANIIGVILGNRSYEIPRVIYERV